MEEKTSKEELSRAAQASEAQDALGRLCERNQWLFILCCFQDFAEARYLSTRA